MAWLRLDADLPGHPKLARLARALGIPMAHAVGLFVGLLGWAMRYRPSGDLSAVDAEDLAVAAGWDSDPEALVNALLAARLLDRDGGSVRIHGWDEKQGPYLRKLARDRERRARAATARRPRRDSEATAPRPRGEYNTKQNETTPTTLSDAEVPGSETPAPAANWERWAAHWNEIATKTGLPRVEKRTDRRIRALRARLAEHGEEAVRRVLEAPLTSAFLRGETGRSGWRGATLDWLLKPDAFVRVLEGAYADREPRAAAPAVSWPGAARADDWGEVQ